MNINEIIKGRKIYVVASGESIRDIKALPKDVCYIFVNCKKIVYELMKRTGIFPSLVTMYASDQDVVPWESVRPNFHEATEFYFKSGVPFLMGNEYDNSAFLNRYSAYSNQMIPWEPDYDKDAPQNHTNSLLKLLYYLKYHGYNSVVLLGCDGVADEDYKLDADDMNRRAVEILGDMEVLNASPISRVKVFKRIDMEGVDG